MEWQKLSLYLHNLGGSGTAGPARNKSSCRWLEAGEVATDALLLLARGVSTHLNTANSITGGHIMVNQLILEQPSLPRHSINRYILCSPPLDAAPEDAGATTPTTNAPGAPLPSHHSAPNVVPEKGGGFVVSFRSHSAKASSSLSASVCFLQPATLNFRPTPISWLINFAKDLVGSDTTTSSSSKTCNSSGGSTEPVIAAHQVSEEGGQASFGRKDEPQASYSTDSGTALGALKQPTACGFSDPLLRDLSVELQSVDFLWSTRDTDLQFATAAVAGASVRLSLYKYSSSFSSTVNDFSLHFVLPKSGATSSSTRRPYLSRREQIHTNRNVSISSSEDSPPRDPRSKNPTLLTMEIFGLVPGQHSTINVALESIHPLSPRFTGLSSRLNVKMGTHRVVYVHPKFWRLFDWMIDDFVGTLISSSPPSSTPSFAIGSAKATGARAGGPSANAAVKLFGRSLSLENIVFKSATGREDLTMKGPPNQQGTEGSEADPASETLPSNNPNRKPLLVPNEGLRRIFLLADAGRRLLGLESCITWMQQQELLSDEATSNSDWSKENVVVPRALPFSVFSYEATIDSARLLLPSKCRPSKPRVVVWPPSSCIKDGRREGPAYLTESSNQAEYERVGACTLCGRRGENMEAFEGIEERQIECLLDSFTVSNAWLLSKKYGVIEGINAVFRGARAFARVSEEPHASRDIHALRVGEVAGQQRRQWSNTASNGMLCRRCTCHASLSSLSSLSFPEASSGTASTEDCEATREAAHGRYLFGSVDVRVHMYRPALFKSTCHWLRLEVGLLPLRLDAQTLKLLCDVVEENIAAKDPDVDPSLVGLAPNPSPATQPCKPTNDFSTRTAPRAAHAATAATATVRLPSDKAPLAKATGTEVDPLIQRELRALVQQLQQQQMLQGLLEPQIDFVELLEEWGREKLILEVIAQGLHLAIFEQPLERQIVSLRRRCNLIKRRLHAFQPGDLTRQRSCPRSLPRAATRQSPRGAQNGRPLKQKPFLLFNATRLKVRPLVIHTHLFPETSCVAFFY